MAEGKARTISSTVFMRNIGAEMDKVAFGKETVIVASRGRPRVAVIAVDEYDALVEARRQLALQRLSRMVPEATDAEI